MPSIQANKTLLCLHTEQNVVDLSVYYTVSASRCMDASSARKTRTEPPLVVWICIVSDYDFVENSVYYLFLSAFIVNGYK